MDEVRGLVGKPARPAMSHRFGRTAAFGLLLLCVVLVAAAIGFLASPRDPVLRTVDELLGVRSSLSTDLADYAGLVDTSTAEGLVRSAVEPSPTGGRPTPGWRRPYLVARRSREATVAVIWKPDSEHPDWAHATLFMLVRDPSADHGWRVSDARTLADTETVPPKSR